MVVNTITEAKAQLSALVDRAARGKRLSSAKRGKPWQFLFPIPTLTDSLRSHIA